MSSSAGYSTCSIGGMASTACAAGLTEDGMGMSRAGRCSGGGGSVMLRDGEQRAQPAADPVPGGRRSGKAVVDEPVRLPWIAHLVHVDTVLAQPRSVGTTLVPEQVTAREHHECRRETLQARRVHRNGVGVSRQVTTTA